MKKIKLTFLKPFLFVCFGLMVATIAVALDPSDPPSKPGTPDVLNIWAGGCTLTFTAPKDDGGSPIIGYFIELKYRYGDSWERINDRFCDGIFYNVDDRIYGSECEFRVTAVNLAGFSEPSDASVMVVFK